MKIFVLFRKYVIFGFRYSELCLCLLVLSFCVFVFDFEGILVVVGLKGDPKDRHESF